MSPAPLRVAFVSHHPHLRMGGQRSMALLIEYLDRAAVRPLVICPGPGPLAEHLATLDCPVAYIPLHHIKPRTLGAVWQSSRRIRALLEERAIDVIAPDAPRDAFTSGLAKIRTATKMVWFVRLTIRHNLDPVLVRMADGVIGVSDDVRRRFSRWKRVAARYRTILDGADLERFRPVEDRPALRRQLAIPLDRPVLLFVGQIKEAKGVLDIVDATARLWADAPPSRGPILFIIGTPDPPAILAEIGRRAEAAGIAEDVRVLPQQEDIQRWMQAADVLVSGSHQDTEGLSRVLFEAMACGAVPVATDIRGNREALTPDTGMLVPERDPDAMAGAVRGVISAAPERLAAWRAAGLASARARYDIRTQVRAVAAFLRDVVRGSLASPSGGDETSAHGA